MKAIQLTQGKVALVDNVDFGRLIQYKWCANFINSKWYAVTEIDGKKAYMHRVITGAPKGMDVDHWDHDGLNNTRKNLRVCTRSNNQGNRGMQKNNKTGYKGVVWHKHRKKYQAQINLNHKIRYLGSFDSPIEAAIAYNEKAVELFGPFAWLNPIPDDHRPSASARRAIEKGQ